MKKLYWAVRWFGWDIREWLTVKWLHQYMKNSDELFVHRCGTKPATLRVERVPPRHTSEYAHSHIEGRCR